MVELWPSSSLSTDCVVSLRGDWAIFCHAGSGRVGRARSAREKSLEILRRGWELNLGHGEDRQCAIPLSYHDWLMQLVYTILKLCLRLSVTRVTCGFFTWSVYCTLFLALGFIWLDVQGAQSDCVASDISLHVSACSGKASFLQCGIVGEFTFRTWTNRWNVEELFFWQYWQWFC